MFIPKCILVSDHRGHIVGYPLGIHSCYEHPRVNERLVGLSIRDE